MGCCDCRRPWGLLILLTGFAAAPAARADVLSVVGMLRSGGCGGLVPIARPLNHAGVLDRAAEQWAAGKSLSEAAARSGYAAQSVAGVHVSGSDEDVVRLLRRSECHAVAGRDLHDIGIYRRGSDSWLVLASPQASGPPLAPASSASQSLASRALKLVNEARARGGICGSRQFGPAPPLSLSGTLASVALRHATDMAVHGYFDHVDPSGQSPADRVRAVGYREKLVGENIAYGPITVEEVVQGWLHSPDHCENIMDPRFAQMGIGMASGQAARRGLFWVQLLAEPRA
ncbi:MAG TPA: CAP domain-containing protein [Steroidobacteraceae bacterium]|nr:CAP domain-containing protein [Steroidobacteraceae bacterium]